MPFPAYARMQEMTVAQAIALSVSPKTIADAEEALAVLMAHGDPSIAEHRAAFHGLHRQVGRFYGHRTPPARWEAP